MASMHIIYASTSGHTEFVVQTLKNVFEQGSELEVTLIRAEKAQREEFYECDALILASGTWNTGGIEGQLNPYMYMLLKGAARDVDLDSLPVGVVGLGDERYHYTARAGEHLSAFVKDRFGEELLTGLRIINEPYDQVAKIEKWGKEFLAKLSETKKK